MRYSKRHLKGLPSPSETVIDSLMEYMSLFASGKYNNFIFRGEPTNYHDTISSALRIDSLLIIARRKMICANCSQRKQMLIECLAMTHRCREKNRVVLTTSVHSI